MTAAVTVGRVKLEASLMRTMEDLFHAGEAILIAALHVFKVKNNTDTTRARLLQALDGSTLGAIAPATATTALQQRRILCLTVRRSRSDTRIGGFRPALHVVKQADNGRYQVSRTVPLRQVLELAVLGKRQGQLGEQQLLRLTLGGDPGSGLAGAQDAVTAVAPTAGIASSAVVHADFELQDEGQLMLCVVLIIQLLRHHAQGRVPSLVGLAPHEVDRWWDLHQEAVCAALGDFAAEVLMPGGLLHHSAAHTAALGARVLVSAKEEGDLEELLDMFAMGIGDVADFERKLTAEHEAHEAANVHTILVNAPMVDAVILQLHRAHVLLDGMDDSLSVFDAKLQTMRGDIAAIEKSNNTLELQARNNGVLLTALQELLEAVRPPPELATTLDDPPFDNGRLSPIVSAGWQLHERLQRLTAGTSGALAPGLLRMRVVRDAREGLTALAARFVVRAAAHLGAVFAATVDEVAQDVVTNSRSTDFAMRTAPPDHSKIRSVCARHSELVRLVRALDPAALPRVCAAYSSATNLLFRKELRSTVSELRKAATADMHMNPIDYSLTKEQPGTGLQGPATSSKAGSSDGDVSVSDAASFRGSVPGMGASSVASLSRQSHSTATGSVNRRPGSRAQPSNVPPMPLNEAFTLLLDNYIPFLTAEAHAAATYLLLHSGRPGRWAIALDSDEEADQPPQQFKSRLSRHGPTHLLEDRAAAADEGPPDSGPPLTPEGEAVMEAIMSGIEAEFQVLVGLTVKSHQVICLPMLAATTRWLAQLAGQPSALCIARTLAACHERLRTNFSAFIAQQLAAIEQYDARRALTSGVKNVHVLAFIRQFALMAHHMEILLGQCASMLPSAAATEGLARRLSCRRRAVAAPSEAHSSDDEDKGGGEEALGSAAMAAVQQAVLAGAAWQDSAPRQRASGQGDEAPSQLLVRSEVDNVYQRLVGAMFTTLERVAQGDAKQGERLRMENYGYFVESVRPLVRHVSALAPYMEQAEARQEDGTLAYVQQQLEYSKLGKLLAWSARLDKLLMVSSAVEVPFQAGCTPADVRNLLTVSLSQLDKSLAAMYARVRKHLGGGSNLTYRLWERMQEQLLSSHLRLEEQLTRCYPAQVLVPDTQQLRQLLAAAASHA